MTRGPVVMSDYRRLVLVAVSVLAVVSIVVALTTITILSRAIFSAQRAMLEEIALHAADVFSALPNTGEGIQEVVAAHQRLRRIGRTRELIVGHRAGDAIVFLGDLIEASTRAVPWSSTLAELMGGGIGVESESGRGSVFRLTIPFEKSLDEARAGVSPSATLRGIRVLIVDDHETARAMLIESVTSWGIDGAAAEDGPRAVDALRSAVANGRPFDLAVIDSDMPGMDGLALVRVVKADPALKSVRLVFLAVLGVRGQAQEAKQAGVAAYLTKPVLQSELYDCLVTVMGIQAGGEPAPLVTRHSLAEKTKTKTKTNGSVLVVEDHVVNQKVAARMLEKLGCRVDVVNNGVEALEALSRSTYDVVLMDGYEAAASPLSR